MQNENVFPRIGARVNLALHFLFFALGGASSLHAQTGIARSQHEIFLAQYRDNSNQEVSTLVGKTWLPLDTNWGFGFKGLAEWIRVTDGGGGAKKIDGNEHSGHADHDPGGASTEMDAVSGASIQGHAHQGSGEGRGEGTLTLRRELHRENPASISGSLRYSGESDFHSSMITFSGNGEFNQRNTAFAGYLGAGMDYSQPKASPPGQSEKWPATTHRMVSGIQIGQILSPRIHAGVSYALSIISGTLENPYRRAQIITTLFPERLPQTRLRQVGSAEINAYFGAGIAGHHRQGGYFDSWGIAAWIPESAIQAEVGEKWMLLARHKYFYQIPADFYQTSYSTLEGWHTGDIRLGHLEAHEFTLGVEYQLNSGPEGSVLAFMASKSGLTYLDGGNRGENYILSLGWRSK